MAFYRMYTGEDKKSHIEQLELSANTEMKKLQTVKGIIFSEAPAGNFIEFYPKVSVDPHAPFTVSPDYFLVSTCIICILIS